MSIEAKRLPIVGVMGSGSEEHADLSRPLGAMIARLGAHLLTGGGRGVMTSVAEGFVAEDARAGLSLGILPGETADGVCDAPAGYPNPWVELPIQTHLPGRGTNGTNGTNGAGAGSRNSINVLSADALVILPGGPGTRSEAELAAQFRRPAVGYGADYEGIPRAESLREVEEFLAGILKQWRRKRSGPS